MKLHSLEIQAFGPFANKEIIEFSALGENALDARMQGYYNVVTPEQNSANGFSGPSWSIGASVSFIFAELW